MLISANNAHLHGFAIDMIVEVGLYSTSNDCVRERLLVHHVSEGAATRNSFGHIMLSSSGK